MSDRAHATAQEIRVVALVSGGHFFSHFFFLVLTPLYLAIQAEYGVSFTELGAIATLYGIGSASGQYPMGVLSDRIGPKWLLIIGLTTASVCVLLMGFTSSYWQLIPLALIAGIGDSVFHPTDFSILTARVSHERLGRAYSIHTFSGFAGFAAAPVVAGGLSLLIGWHLTLTVLGAAGLVMAALLLLNRSCLTGDDRVAVKRPAGAPPPGSVGDAFSVFRSVPILLIFGFYVTMGLAGQGITQFTPAALPILYQVGELAGSHAVTTYLVASAIGILAGGYVADRYARIEIITTVAYLVAIVMFAMIAAVIVPFYIVLAALFVAGVFYGAVMPARDLLVRGVAPKGATGKAFGFVNTGYGIASGIGPVLFGWVMDTGFLSGIYVGAAAFFAVSILFALAAAHYVRTPQASTAPAQ